MDRRTVIAIVLIFLLMMIWMKRVQHRDELRRQAELAQAAREAPAQAAPETPEAPAPVETKPAPPAPQAPPAASVTSGPAQETAWTNLGGCIRRLRLTQHHAALDDPEPLTLLDAPEERADIPGTLLLRDVREPRLRLPFDTTAYRVEEKPDRSGLAYTADFATGVRLTKTVSRSPENPYFLDLTLRFENTSSAPIKNFQYEIVAGSRIVPRLVSYQRIIQGFYALQSGDKVRYEHVSADDALKTLAKEGKPRQGKAASGARLVAAGVANRYFAAALIPRPARDQLPWVRDANVFGIPKVDPQHNSAELTSNVYVTLVTEPETLEPGRPWVHRYQLFAGPKDPDIVSRYPVLAGVITYGGIAKILEAILRFFYSIVGNYGFAIVLLTLLVKCVLFPLTWKSQTAMYKMQRLQPLINQLREKYKNDKQRLAKEQMALMKHHGANPLTGCLPMLLQLPIFFGLFTMIQNSITMRHQPFIFWVRDLSSPDTVGTVGGFPINILPVLMVITWVVQQMTMPKPQDPQQQTQQKMMLIMPVIFGFMFYNFASSMSLYWFTSTLSGIIEQKVIKTWLKRHHSAPLAMPAALAGADPASPGTPEVAAPENGGISQPRGRRPPKRPGGRRKR